MSAPLGVILSSDGAEAPDWGHPGETMLGGRCLYDRAADRLGLQVAGLALQAQGNVARLGEFGLPVLPPAAPDRSGPLAGVLAGLDWAAARGSARIVTVPADAPFLPADLVERLVRGADRAGTRIAIAAEEDEGRLRRHAEFALWPVSLRADLRSALKQGVQDLGWWASSHGAASVLFASEGFFRIDGPEALARAEAMLPGFER